MKNKRYIAVISVFLAVIFVLGISSIAKRQSDFSVKENRALEVRPDFSFDELMDGTFQEDYSNYLADQFIFRDKWVTAKTYVMKAIGKKDINGVYLGKDGYLAEKYTPSDFDSDTVEQNLISLEDFLTAAYDEDEYKTVSCAFVPSKGTVLTDKFSGITPYNMDKNIVSDVSENTEDINILYLKDALSKHQNEYIYYKSDHHWTSLGAYYAYLAYVKSIGLSPVDIKSLKKDNKTDSFLGSDYDKLQINTPADSIWIYDNNNLKVTVDYNGEEKNTKSLYVNKYLGEKDKYAYFLGGNYKKINIKTNANTGRKLLLVKDSFSNSIVPFLCNNFDEIVMVDLRYADDSVWTVMSDEENITDVLVLYNTEKFAQDSNQWLLDDDR